MKHGFSLVELSIVLVILGLLTGGILGGQALIRAAELRSLSNDYSRYRTATYTFRDKYFAFPGDFDKATNFWNIRTGSGSATGSDTACVSTLNVTTGTCNGISDGILGNNAAWGFSAGYGLSERFLFWQHLALAGLIEGSYSGSYYSNSPIESPQGYSPANAPAGKISGSYWTAAMFQSSTSTADFNGFVFEGNTLYPRSYGTNYMLLSPEEAWNIDTKVDDGRPGQGALFTHKNTSTTMPGCTTSDELTAEYSLSNSSKICSLLMKI